MPVVPMENAALVPGVRAPEEAVNTYPLPATVPCKGVDPAATMRTGKAATPLVAGTMVVPKRDALSAFAPSVNDTLPTKLGVGLPNASSAVTTTGGLIGR